MVSRENIESCFQNLGCDIKDNAVIDKCLELCSMYEVDEETLAELWVAFSVQRFTDFDPTLEALIQLENVELKTKRDKSFASKESNVREVPMPTADSIKEDVSCMDVLNIYGAAPNTTSTLVGKRSRSPGTEVDREDGKLRAVDNTFNPSTYTPKPGGTPARAPSTAVRGKVLLNFGPDVASWERKNTSEDVSLYKSGRHHVPKDMVYMFEMLSKQGSYLSSSCEDFGLHLCSIWNENGDKNVRYVRNVKSISQTPFRTWGRISTRFDKSTCAKSVMLEGCRRERSLNNAPLVHLDLSNLKRYSVFPGQIVAVEGTNNTGSLLVVKEIFTNGYAAIPKAPRLVENLRVYVAAGPFTASDNLNYQPLWDLMEHVTTEEPDVLILIGPFVEYTHSEIRAATIRDTFQELFEKIVSRILESLKGKSTRLVLVPSQLDAHHDPVFPTPEYTIWQSKVPTDTNLCLMPDPCVLNVEGLLIGVTSVDSVKHLGHEEVSNTPGMDRLGRLANHVLSQATFYPLYPPPEDLNLDTTLWKKYACFEEQPHVLILPSDIRYYCKVANQCLVLNPERLKKYTYAKLCVRPSSGEKWDPNNVSCEVAKV